MPSPLIPNIHLNFEYNGKPLHINDLLVSFKKSKKNLKTYSRHHYFCEKEQRSVLVSNELELLLSEANR